MAGHSRWAQVKYRKSLTDAKRAKVFSKLSRLISLAAKKGADPTQNLELSEAISQSREVNLPQENIERAIRRGAGEVSGRSLEEALFEAYGPAGIPILITAVTDNRNRTLSRVREVLKAHEGKLAEPGSVRWLFEEVGSFTLAKSSWSEDLELWFIDQATKEIKKDQEVVIVYLPKENFEGVRRELLEKNLPFESRLEFLAKTPSSPVQEDLKEKLEALFGALEDQEEVTEIYSNVEV
ncbi:MAG: YebC/PmpR family DNA-binding transcriptional regulator [Parcubacteria group bacterium]|nr:YebC/PmpR family DNA-binding transcriptional regulator [Parcubacteria group bacterium]